MKFGSLSSKKLKFTKTEKNAKIYTSEFENDHKKPLKNKFDNYYF